MRSNPAATAARAGVPETVAKELTGRKTDSVFYRYDIVSPNDLLAAGLDGYAPTAKAQ